MLPLYLRASVGDILLAILAGFLQLKLTVSKENKVAPINIIGLKDTSDGIAAVYTPLEKLLKAIGTIPNDTMAPSIKPIGIPIKDNLKACPFTIFFICLGDVPTVFISP